MSNVLVKRPADPIHPMITRPKYVQLQKPTVSSVGNGQPQMRRGGAKRRVVLTIKLIIEPTTRRFAALEFGHFNSGQNQKFVPRPLGEGAPKGRVRVEKVESFQ